MPQVQSAFLAGGLCLAGGSAALRRLQRRYAAERFGPADLVTLVRAVLVCVVVAVTVAEAPATVLAPVLTTALVLDWVDGRVARATGTTSDFGARFDMEVDALLILVLSVSIAVDVGWWVLGIGLVRYVFAALVWLLPRLQAPPPPRAWCKVVAAIVGVVLAAVAIGLLPHPVELVALAVIALLLVESFAREAVDRWHGQARAGDHVLVLDVSHG